MQRALTLIALISSVAISLVLASCQKKTDRHTATKSNQVAALNASPVAVYGKTRAEGQIIGDAAALSGTLKLRDGCLVIASTTTYDTQPVFHYYSVQWNFDQKTLTYDGKMYALGDMIHLSGGGVVSRQERQQLEHRSDAHIPQCTNTQLFLVNG